MGQGRGRVTLQFKPQRWLEDDLKKAVSDCQYPVFNVGRRSCLGKPMALLETKLLVATVLRRYEIKLDPGHSMQFNLAATLTFTHGLHVTLTKKK